MPLPAGTRLGPYEILEPLGVGGMGEVYRAHDQKLDRDIALKVLPEGSIGNDEARKRFRKEAHALSRLSHPHIATILDFDTQDGTDYLAMELVRGHSLRDELEARGPLPEKTVVRLGAQIAHGLQAAHEQGVIHRDLKPSNLQLTPDGLVKILDFGLARLVATGPGDSDETAPTETAVGRAAGTLPYMSPEQLRGRGVDGRTDLYAVGAVLYELATGRRLFTRESAAELTEAILSEEPTPPRALNDRLTPGLEAVILKALDKDQELRYQTAKDLLVDLERLQVRSDPRSAGSGPAEVAASGASAGGAGDTPAHRRHSRRRIFVFAAVAAAFVAVVVGAVWLALPTRPPRITAVHSLAMLVPSGWVSALQVVTDGARIYYVNLKDGQNVLYQIPISGGDPLETPLPFRGNVFLLGAIPGESALLVAGSLEDLAVSNTDEGWPLWRVPLPAGAPQRVGDLLARYAEASPDGRTLALTRGRSIILASMDGSDQRELYEVQGDRPRGIRWAPDGNRLRFHSRGPGDEEEWIWEISLTGEPPRPLWPGHLGDWTGDGRYYVFDRPPTHDLFASKESWWTRWLPTAPQPVTSGPLAYTFLGSSSDGRRLLATFYRRGHANRATLMRFNAEEKIFEAALGGESAFYAEPSPDGEWLAWVRYPEGTLWRSRPDGSDRLQLTSPPAVAHLPRWSPDGRRIVFASQADPSGDGQEIRVVAADGSEGELVARPESSHHAYFNPCWLPDGSILFSHIDPRRPGILRYDPGTRQVEPVRGGETLLYPVRSRQGDVLATAVSESGWRWKVRRRGATEWRDLGSFGHTHTHPNWTRDGRSICALSVRGYRIECMNVEEGRMTVLTDTSPLELVTWVAVPWMGLDAEDRPFVAAAPGQDSTIFALDWDVP